MSALGDALKAERDAALEEAGFERTRAAQALRRNQELREQLQAVREQLAAHLGEEDRSTASLQERELADRLRLAMDTNWRLERIRARLEQKLVETTDRAEASDREVARLALRVKALEGQLKLG
ncbi:MAG: hypothetical protein GY913_25105 [Proteobacteria bacterium]|nr:hypothetical protein [Pseudomonadota bacterium]MCP4920192.1 hypothetical protein [Pseudomonadota bacterium]